MMSNIVDKIIPIWQQIWPLPEQRFFFFIPCHISFGPLEKVNFIF